MDGLLQAARLVVHDAACEGRWRGRVHALNLRQLAEVQSGQKGAARFIAIVCHAQRAVAELQERSSGGLVAAARTSCIVAAARALRPACLHRGTAGRARTRLVTAAGPERLGRHAS